MRRYLYEGKIEKAAQHYDVVIIGSGMAGLYTALNLDERLSCLVVSKLGIEKSNSWLAQGGIAAAIAKDDAPAFHFEDTIIAGAGLCDPLAVRTLVDEGPEAIHKLVSLNVPFDLDEDGDLAITREGGHNRNRIVHCGGDATGRETVKTLAAIAAHQKNISFMEYTFLCDIIVRQGKTAGVVVFDSEYKLISTPSVVIATGGIGQIYGQTTNPAVATGDGIAAAVRAGAKLSGMEFVQFHPTGLYQNKSVKRTFLISEAVRGEGGILRNKFGEAFMKDRHPQKDLAPRDIVAREITREQLRTDADHVDLDITAKSAAYLQKRFPTIYQECMDRGIDISKSTIPVCPVQHFMMGGIKTDLFGMSNIPGLYACGEAASTGVHGANRLASNSMLECLVFGRRCAVHISENAGHGDNTEILSLHALTHERSLAADSKQAKDKIRQLMRLYGWVNRSGEGLKTALVQMTELLRNLEGSSLPDAEHMEALNMATVAHKVLAAALKRRESVGAHYREDEGRNNG